MKRTWAKITGFLLAAAMVLAFPVIVRADDFCPYSYTGTHVPMDGSQVQMTAPTCTLPGRDQYTCAYCHSTYFVEVPALGHYPLSSPHLNEKEPTCTENGSYDIFTWCMRCGATLSSEKIIVPATGHNWDWGTVTTPATCTTDGVITYHCQTCGTALTQAIPATGHTVATMPAKEATCEEVGLTEGQYCSTCGEILLYQYSSPALGHDWDEGVVQGDEDALLHDHDIVFTCSRCGKTRTKTVKINAADFWSTVYKPTVKTPPDGGIPSEAVDLLYIKEQPKDLEIEWEEGNMGTLTLKAEGGTEPYTYYWTVVPEFTTRRSGLGLAFIDNIEEMGFAVVEGMGIAQSFGEAEIGGNEISSAKPPIKGSFTIADKISDDIAEILEGDTTETPEYELLPAGAFTTETDVPELQVEVGSAAGYTAWCTVYDAKGDHVTSEKVQIFPALKIIEQPYNINIEDPEAAFTVKAAYGKEPYTYQWQYFSYGSDEFVDIEESDAPDAKTAAMKPVRGFDQVRCIVTDDNGKSVASEPAMAYSAPVLEVTAPEEVFFRPGEEAELSATFAGGTAPYTLTWTRSGGDGEVLDSYEVAEEPAGTWYVYGLNSEDDSAYGSYVFTVEDSMGQIKDAVVKASYRDLTIVTQPEDGQLDINGDYEVSIEMGEGTMRFTYSLREVTHEEIASETTGSSVWSHTLHESAIYYIYVTDANGLHAESNYFWVGDYEVKIVSQPDVIEINDPEVFVQADLLVEGGEGPYTLKWFKINENTGDFEEIVQSENGENKIVWDEETDSWARLSTCLTGTYMLEATDKNNVTGVSKPFEAVYTGSRPYITVQPQSAEYEIDAGRGRSDLSYTLDCQGETATGDYVTYLWQYLNENGGWSLVPLQTMYARDPALHGAGWADYPHQEFRRVDESRMYRCKVTNNRTGEYTYSEPAFIRLQLNCINSGQSGTGNAIWAEYFGGAWPYKFLIREKYPPNFYDVWSLHGTDGNNRSYTLPDFVQYWDSNDDMGFFQLDIIGGKEHALFKEYNCLVSNAEQSIMISDITGGIYCHADGLARRWRYPDDKIDESSDYYHRVYQIRIEDRFGDTCTAPWVRMTSPMTTAEKAYNIFFFGIFGADNSLSQSDHSGW